MNSQDQMMLMTIILNVDSTYSYVLSRAGAMKKDLRGAIALGLVVRQFKLYQRIMSAYNQKDGELCAILSRFMFENAVTIQVILNDQSGKTTKTFIKTNARRNKQVFDDLDNMSPVLPDELKTPIQKVLCDDITQDGFDFSLLQGEVKGTWHPGKSYEDMAGEVKMEALYKAEYQMGSNAIHPSWDNLKKYHLDHSEDGDWVPLVTTRETGNGDILRVLCSSLLVLEVYMACVKAVKQAEVDRIRGIHRTLHTLKLDTETLEL